MNSIKSVAVLIAATLVVCSGDAARAYRPFDGTDAAVAETGEVEIELGPVEYLRNGSDRTLLAEGETTPIVADAQMRRTTLPDKYLIAFREAIGK